MNTNTSRWVWEKVFPAVAWNPSWFRFYIEARKDFRLYLCGVVLLTAFRALPIVLFFDRMASSSQVGDILAALLNTAPSPTTIS